MRVVVAYAREGYREFVGSTAHGAEQFNYARLVLRGKEEAAWAGKQLARLPVERVVTSSARSSRQSGLIIKAQLEAAGMTVPIVDDPLLIEKGFLRPNPQSWVAAEDPVRVVRYSESTDRFRRRVEDFARRLLEVPPDGVVVAVTHRRVVSEALETVVGRGRAEVSAGRVTIIAYGPSPESSPEIIARNVSRLTDDTLLQIRSLLPPTRS